MKKLNHIIGFKAFAILLMMFGMAHFAMAASVNLTYSPSSPQAAGTVVSIHGNDSVGSYAHIYDASGAEVQFGYAGSSLHVTWTTGTAQTYKVAECDNTVGACNTSIPLFSSITGNAGYNGYDSYVVSAPPATGISALIDDSSANFQATTGFPIVTTGGDEGVVNWAGDNLIKLFIGSGLALLFYLRFWIVALAIIAAIVFFSFRAFQFFRH